MRKTTDKKTNNSLTRFLGKVEAVGNALPHPAILFLILWGIVVAISFIASSAGFTAVHPIKKETIETVNLLSVKGLHLFLTDMVKNFAGFAPLGTVLVAMLGFSIAEKSGMLSTLIRLIVQKAHKNLIIPAVLLAGILTHTAGDIGYVLLIPLAAMAFHSLGMHPLAGLAVSFAGVSGGFAANFLLSTADPLLGGLSQEAARIIDPNFVVTPLANWYFMASSSLLIILVGTFIANKITIPFLGKYTGVASAGEIEKLTEKEKKGLIYAGLVTLAFVLVICAGLIPANGFLREEGTGDVFHSPLLKGIIVVVFLWGSLTGLAFGFTTKAFKNTNDVISAMQEAMATLAPYIVLVFFASQFISLFNASNIGIILAVHGSEFLKDLGLGAIPLMIGFILLTVILDLVMGSASAKWALMAPIFIPMFMLLGYSPALTQASYRIGDSVVNIISPLMSYFPLILSYANRYDPKAKVGTLIALMLPYSLFFLLFWSIMLFVWMTMGWPVGPGAPLWIPLQ